MAFFGKGAVFATEGVKKADFGRRADFRGRVQEM